MSNNATTEVTLHMCGDCGEIMAKHRLRKVEISMERLTPGDIVPSGECPHCCSLCSPLEPHGDMKRILTVTDIGMEIIKCPKNASETALRGIHAVLLQIKRIIERDEG